MQKETGLEKFGQNAVEFAISLADAKKQFDQFRQLKTDLLDKYVDAKNPGDFQEISGKQFIKKSGWRKIALVFNISDSIVWANRTDRDDGSFLQEFTVRATAPNGRYTDATGSCDSRERRFAHTEHDVKATAHTRAKSRAISDLVGGGEVSAEEMEESETAQTSATDSKIPPQSQSINKPETKSNGWKSLTKFQNADRKEVSLKPNSEICGKLYSDLAKEGIAFEPQIDKAGNITGIKHSITKEETKQVLEGLIARAADAASELAQSKLEASQVA